MRWYLVLLLAGCQVPPLSTGPRQCPCAPGWSCDNTRMVCVEDVAPGADGGRVLDTTICDEVPSAYFCDGFEADRALTWNGDSVVDGAVAQNAPAYRGVLALDALTHLAMGHAYVSTENHTFTAPELWVRFYAWLDPAITADHFLIMFVSGPSDDGIAIGVMNDHWWVENTIVASEPVLATSSITVTRGSWVCLELQVQVAGTNGTATGYLGGEMMATSSGLSTSPTGGTYANLAIGLQHTFPEQATAHVRIDEVVVSPTRVPCD